MHLYPKATGQFGTSAYVLLAHADELLEEPEGGEGPPQVDTTRGKLREVVHLSEGLRRRDDDEWESHELWSEDPVMDPSGSRSGGRGLRPGRQNAAEALTKYIIVDMYAKAIQGMSAEDAVKRAERSQADSRLNGLAQNHKDLRRANLPRANRVSKAGSQVTAERNSIWPLAQSPRRHPPPASCGAGRVSRCLRMSVGSHSCC